MRPGHQSASLALIGWKNNSGSSGVLNKVLLAIAAPVDALICVCISHISDVIYKNKIIKISCLRDA